MCIIMCAFSDNPAVISAKSVNGVLIALFGPSHIGKTSTITRVAQKLGMNQEYGVDFSEVCPNPICDCIIGLASMGDPGSAQKDSVKALLQKKCRIIVCASRTSGKTVGDLNELAKEYGYSVIWLSPFYQTDLVFDPKIMQESSADAVISLIEKMAIILS